MVKKPYCASDILLEKEKTCIKKKSKGGLGSKRKLSCYYYFLYSPDSQENVGGAILGATNKQLPPPAFRDIAFW